MGPVSLMHPLAFILVPLVLLAARLGRLRVGGRWRVATFLRTITLALLILAMSGPVVRIPVSSASVVFAVDRSVSMTAAGWGAEEEFLRAALARAHPQDRAGVVVFAGRPLLRTPVEASGAAGEIGPAPEPDRTDIGAAIDLALRVLPAEGVRRIVVLSDGAENRGSAAGAARAAAAAGVGIDAVPIAVGPREEVLVDEVVAPAEVRAGEAYEVRAVLRATVAALARVTLRRDGVPVATRTVSLAPGETAVTFPAHAPREGIVRYAVDVDASPDTIRENNHGEALVVVRDQPRVLFVTSSPSTLPRWLERQGLRLDVRPPDEVPTLATDLAPYGSVVLDDVAAGDLSRAQQDVLRAFVGQGGGGLVAIGGPHSFGVGGYAGTPLEDILPVTMDVRQTTTLPTVAIVLVIDTSGSMEAFGTEIAKEELAKEIASSVIDLLGEHDQIGVITFDQEYRWLVPPTEARNRAQVLEQVARLRAGGGTVMYPPLAAAREFLRASRARIRHAIVLSDGLTDPGDFRGLATTMAREKMTVSTVAIGRDADVEFMRALARWGGGRTYIARDLYSIPEIFTTEALMAVRSYIVEEVFPPLRTGPAPTLTGLTPPPEMRGYIASVAKPTSEVALTSPHRDPILASWQYGLGRTIAFTSDDGLRWTAPWARWSDVARFWSQVVRWTLRDPGQGFSVTASLDASGTAARAVLEARQADDAPWDGLAVTGDLEASPRDHLRVSLDQTAPGRYEGTWPVEGPGTYALTISARSPGGVVGTRTVGVVVPYSPELRTPGGNLSVLSHLVETTGGAFLHSPEEAFRPGRGRGEREAWPPLAALALGAFVAEIALRRIPDLARHIAGSASAIAAWMSGKTKTSRAATGAGDRAYDAADRWAVEEEQFAQEEALRATSMEQAARLYIARLRAGKRS